MIQHDNNNTIKNSLWFSILMPSLFIAVAWMVFIFERSWGMDLSIYGLLPREITHWYGILTMPFLHGDLSHIFFNSISFIGMGTLLFYFYPKHCWKVFGLSYIFCGVITWLIGRSNYHIGASAMIYAFSAYIFTTGIKSRNRKLLAVSLIVIIINGGMLWGVLPQETGISWEGHLAGLICGVIFAFIYKAPKEISLIPDRTEQLYTKFTLGDYDSTENADVEITYYYKK